MSLLLLLLALIVKSSFGFHYSRSHLISKVNMQRSDCLETADFFKPTILDISSRESLLAQFTNYATTLTLPFPLQRDSVPNRFERLKFTRTVKLFDYNVRESFDTLVTAVEKLTNSLDNNILRYMGNDGAGKSYNLAALTVYLRECKKHNLGVNKDIVYIPSCYLLFSGSMQLNMALYLSEVFPADKTILLAMKEWDQLVKYIHMKPKRSIIFIFDAWNDVCGDKLIDNYYNKKRCLYASLLHDISDTQLRIEGIDTWVDSFEFNRDALTHPADDPLTHPPGVVYTTLYGGLSDTEWATYKTHSVFISSLSAEEETMLRDFTGDLPLHLAQIEGYEGDLTKRIHTFHMKVGRSIESQLKRSAVNFYTTNAVDKDKFITQMMHALIESPLPQSIDDTLYDHRYFYSDCNNTLRPTSGFVRNTMIRLLHNSYKDDYYHHLNSTWLDKALSSTNASVRRFALKHYALAAIINNPSAYLEGVPSDLTGVNIKYFHATGADDVYPRVLVPVRYAGVTLFLPDGGYIPHVDFVAKYVTGGQVDSPVIVYAIKLILEGFEGYNYTTQFFTTSTTTTNAATPSTATTATPSNSAKASTAATATGTNATTGTSVANTVATTTATANDGKGCDAYRYLLAEEIERVSYKMTWITPKPATHPTAVPYNYTTYNPCSVQTDLPVVRGPEYGVVYSSVVRYIDTENELVRGNYTINCCY